MKLPPPVDCESISFDVLILNMICILWVVSY